MIPLAIILWVYFSATMPGLVEPGWVPVRIYDAVKECQESIKTLKPEFKKDAVCLGYGLEPEGQLARRGVTQ